jgi:hypothetical protein
MFFIIKQRHQFSNSAWLYAERGIIKYIYLVSGKKEHAHDEQNQREE